MSLSIMLRAMWYSSFGCQRYTKGDLSMHVLDRSRWYLIVLLMISLIPAAPVWSAYGDGDILGFRVLSESQDELVIEIQSYYTGNLGPKAHISVFPTLNGQTANVGYSAARCPNSNSVFAGHNSTCITLSSTIRGSQFVTNGLQICMFGGPSGGSFHCENLAHTKQWGLAPQSTPAGGGSIRVTTIVNPPVVSRGQQTLVRVYVQDGQGRPLPQAMVTLSSGGGRFARTGTPSVSGLTDSSGSFVDYWSCNPCSRAYVNGVKVTKPGYTEANAGWRVDIP